VHTKPMAESEGSFGDWKPSKSRCEVCGGEVLFRIWESSCGGYEDYKFKCTSCGKVRWVDGPDS